MIVDFHTHTTESDGELTPAQLIERVQSAGIDYLSITDHDTLAAYDDHAGVLAGVRAKLIIGVEVSTHMRGVDMHLLAYKVPLGASALRELLRDRTAKRWQRTERILERLQRLGFPLTAEELRRFAKGAIVGRKHIAKAMVARGCVRDTDEAFAKYLSSAGSAYVPSTEVTPLEAIRIIRESGAVPVLAHPSRSGASAFIPELVRVGLAGLEISHAAHSANEQEHYRRVARALDLPTSAGSDFHEPTEQRPAPGVDVEREEIERFLALVT